jgi:hypothetical protein
MSISKNSSGLNEAQVSFLKTIALIQNEKELREIRQLIARYFADKIRQETKGLAEELGVTTKKGAKDFLQKNHYRTPYKKK